MFNPKMSLVRRSIQICLVAMAMCSLGCSNEHNDYVRLLTNDSVRYWYDVYPARGGVPQIMLVCEFHVNGAYDCNYIFPANGNKYQLEKGDVIGPDSWSLISDSMIVFRNNKHRSIMDSGRILRLSDEALVLISSDSIVSMYLPSEVFSRTRFKNN